MADTKETSKSSPKRDDDFGVWMFQHGKGKEVAKHNEEIKKKLNEEANKEKASRVGYNMAEKKENPGKKDIERPDKQKDGSIRMGGKILKNEKEFEAYLDKIPIIDSEK